MIGVLKIKKLFTVGATARRKMQMSMIKRFMKDESGATAIEYGLIAALISLAIIAGLKIIGPELKKTFSSIGTALQSATS